jgi:glycosyltransferase involved in cell wall biosynthesis
MVRDPVDATELAHALTRVMESQVDVSRMQELGFEQAARFTWSAAAQKLRSVYVRALG